MENAITPANKSHVNESKAAANSLQKKQSADKAASPFEDNRPETVVQRKMQVMADSASTHDSHVVQMTVNRISGDENNEYVIRVFNEQPNGRIRVKQENGNATNFLIIIPFAQGMQVHIHYNTPVSNSVVHIYTDPSQETRVEINQLLSQILERFNFGRLLKEAKARYTASVFDEYGSGAQFNKAVQESNNTYRRGDNLLQTTYDF